MNFNKKFINLIYKNIKVNFVVLNQIEKHFSFTKRQALPPQFHNESTAPTTHPSPPMCICAARAAVSWRRTPVSSSSLWDCPPRTPPPFRSGTPGAVSLNTGPLWTSRGRQGYRAAGHRERGTCVGSCRWRWRGGPTASWSGATADVWTVLRQRAGSWHDLDNSLSC